ncbi:MAG: hypothetical protein RI909_1062, partial [Bacteroidota bacterium]
MFIHQLFLIPALTGPVFMVMGVIMKKFPPKKINGFYGYRTSSSMKTQDRWDSAQNYSANEMIKLGFLLLMTSVAGLALNFDELIEIVLGLGLMIVMVVLLIVRTEIALQ